MTVERGIRVERGQKKFKWTRYSRLLMEQKQARIRRLISYNR